MNNTNMQPKPAFLAEVDSDEIFRLMSQTCEANDDGAHHTLRELGERMVARAQSGEFSEELKSGVVEAFDMTREAAYKDFNTKFLEPALLEMVSTCEIRRADFINPNHNRLERTEYTIAPSNEEGSDLKEPCVISVNYDDKGREKSRAGYFFKIQIGSASAGKIIQAINGKRAMSITDVKRDGRGRVCRQYYVCAGLGGLSWGAAIDLGVDTDPECAVKCTTTREMTATSETPLGALNVKRRDVSIIKNNVVLESYSTFEGTCGGKKLGPALAQGMFNHLTGKIGDKKVKENPDFFNVVKAKVAGGQANSR
ncbi:MAG: hypothetical protein LBG89_03730 [Rickettsiales bacterium]|jgi:hypothetical protein|nr:hypothetical protein [Rickettsiales bacterium]